MPTAQIVKWGNSLAIRIPKPVAEQAGVEEGDPVTVEAERGEIRLSRAECIPNLKQLVAEMTADNRYHEVSSGPAREKEEVEWQSGMCREPGTLFGSILIRKAGREQAKRRPRSGYHRSTGGDARPPLKISQK